MAKVLSGYRTAQVLKGRRQVQPGKPVAVVSYDERRSTAERSRLWPLPCRVPMASARPPISACVVSPLRTSANRSSRRICGLALLSRHQILNRPISAQLERHSDALHDDVVNPHTGSASFAGPEFPRAPRIAGAIEPPIDLDRLPEPL